MVFDGKSNLATTRDYSRAVEKAPSGIVAFGGYNLEAAIAAARSPRRGRKRNLQTYSSSFASAFHSQNFFATAAAGTIEAHSSVAMDRQGRYPVADFSVLTKRQKHHLRDDSTEWRSDHRSEAGEQSRGQSKSKSAWSNRQH